MTGLSEKLRDLGRLALQLDSGEEMLDDNLQQWPEQVSEMEELAVLLSQNLNTFLRVVQAAAAHSKEHRTAKGIFVDRLNNAAMLAIPQNMKILASNSPDLITEMWLMMDEDVMKDSFQKVDAKTQAKVRRAICDAQD